MYFTTIKIVKNELYYVPACIYEFLEGLLKVLAFFIAYLFYYFNAFIIYELSI